MLFVVLLNKFSSEILRKERDHLLFTIILSWAAWQNRLGLLRDISSGLFRITYKAQICRSLLSIAFFTALTLAKQLVNSSSGASLEYIRAPGTQALETAVASGSEGVLLRLLGQDINLKNLYHNDQELGS